MLVGGRDLGVIVAVDIGVFLVPQLMQAPQWDRALLGDLCTAMADASICGLGQAAPNPIRLVMRHFSDEI